MFYNPTLSTLSQTISVPLYYTGIKNQAYVHETKETGFKKGSYFILDREYSIELQITVAPQSWLGLIFENADSK
jgi:hypothetical protein